MGEEENSLDCAASKPTAFFYEGHGNLHLLAPHNTEVFIQIILMQIELILFKPKQEYNMGSLASDR